MVYAFDFHVHTHCSPDCRMKVPQIAARAMKLGFAGLAITDHETVLGAFEMRDYVKKNNLQLRVIIGQEKKTKQGEILALFIKKRITADNVADAIEQVRAQDGLVVLPHPFRNNPQLFQLAGLFDFVEVFNSRTNAQRNGRAIEFAHRNNLKPIAGSDAHLLFELGCARVYFNSLKDIKGQLMRSEYELVYQQRHELSILLAKLATATVKGGFLYASKKLLTMLVDKTKNL